MKKKTLGDNLSKSNIETLQKFQKFYNKHNNKINSAEDFPLFITREKLIYYLAKYQLFLKTLNIKGSIIECGSYKGSSLMLFSKLTSIYEPYNIHKKVISFDTFKGFPEISKKDNLKNKNTRKNYGNDANLNLLKESIEIFNSNRFNNHIEKVEIIQGNATKTIPKYVKQNQHLLISLLYLDFDLFEPTQVAIKNFIPRMSKGSILAFDQLNQKRWSGETMGMLKNLNINNFKLRQLEHEPNISYIKL